jgi:molybdopterin-binding protein
VGLGAEDLLAVGDEVAAVIKSSEVIIDKE